MFKMPSIKCLEENKMKFIFLLILLVSCGKKYPEYQVNSRERLGIKQVNSYSFELENLVQMKGVLKIHTEFEDKKVIDIEFSTIANLKSHIMRLLTVNSHFLFKNISHDERMKIFIKNYSPLIEYLVPEKEYKITLNFNHLSKQQYKLFFIQENIQRDLGFIDYDSTLHLSGAEILELFQNRAFLSINDTNGLTKGLNNNHYRVYYSNSESKVLYVSNEVSFEDFLSQNNIDHARNIELINLMTTIDIKTLEGWWYRRLPGGDYVLINEDISQIHQAFLSTLVKVPFSLTRKEGIGALTSIYADPKSRILLELHGTKISRNFQTRIEQINALGSTCVKHKTIKKGDFEYSLNFNELQSLRFNQEEASQIESKSVNPGTFEIVFQLNAINSILSLDLPDLMEKVTVGYTAYECNDRPVPYKLSTNKISPEKVFELKGEAFVERRHLSF